MKSIKKSITTRLAALLFGAALFGLASQSALAVGTPAGTTISNTATLNYTVGAVAQTPILTTPVTFLVSNKVDMTVSRSDLTAVNVSSGSTTTTGVTTFTVTNVGNNTQDFGLTPAALASGTANPFAPPSLILTSTFAVTGCAITNVAISGGTGTYLTTGTNYPDHVSALTAGATATVQVTCTVPAGQANNALAVDQLTATAISADTLLTSTAGVANPAVVQTVVVPAGSIRSVTDAYLVQTATLAVTKSQAVICDQINGGTNPKYIPGAYVQYAVTIANTGSAAATLQTLTDTLQGGAGNGLLLDPTLVGGAALTAAQCVAGGPSLSASGFAAVYGAGTGTPAPVLTGNTSAVTAAGASASGQLITITYGSLVNAGGSNSLTGFAGGSLPAGQYITVYFNAIVQ